MGKTNEHLTRIVAKLIDDSNEEQPVKIAVDPNDMDELWMMNDGTYPGETGELRMTADGLWIIICISPNEWSRLPLQPFGPA